MEKKANPRRFRAIRAAALVLAALILAAGLEWVMQRTLPPVFTDAEVDISSDPTLIERGTTYLHASGRPALKEEWHLPRLAAVFALQLALLALLFPLGGGRRVLTALRSGFQSLKRVIRDEKTRNLKLAGCFLCVFAAVYLISRVWIRDVYHRDNWMTGAVCVWAGLGAGCLAAFRRTLGKKPEVLFLVLTLIAGGLTSFLLPDATGVSLDDGYHFQHALNYSTLGHVRFTGAEWDAMQTENVKEYRLAEREAFLAAEDEKYAEGAVFVTSGFHLEIKEYWMGTCGLGLFLGRLFGLRFCDIWSLGRFTGLLAYALIGYFAVRRLKSGKMILALSLMTPSCVFLASNYSYDPGVIAGITLSCAYWIAQWQEPEEKLKLSDAAVMLLGMAFACYVKAIYFPIYLLFLFLPGGKFRDGKHRKTYTAAVLLAMALVMCHILIPMGRSGGQGDVRGDGNVNTFGQVQFILQNPLTYAETLWHFLQNYLDPNRMQALVNSFGYQGSGDNMTLILMILAVVTFTDANEEGLLPGAGIRVFGEALLFGALALMITSMYVWFTEVGAPEIDGMQQRYMIPFMYPAMALLGSGRIRNRMNPALYNGILFAGMTFTIFSTLLSTCVEYYH